MFILMFAKENVPSREKGPKSSYHREQIESWLPRGLSRETPRGQPEWGIATYSLSQKIAGKIVHREERA